MNLAACVKTRAMQRPEKARLLLRELGLEIEKRGPRKMQHTNTVP